MYKTDLFFIYEGRIISMRCAKSAYFWLKHVEDGNLWTIALLINLIKVNMRNELFGIKEIIYIYTRRSRPTTRRIGDIIKKLNIFRQSNFFGFY
jgi:hypothetical protein